MVFAVDCEVGGPEAVGGGGDRDLLILWMRWRLISWGVQIPRFL